MGISIKNLFKKDSIVGISIVVSVAITFAYSYDFYRASKLLDIKHVQSGHLTSDAVKVSLYKLIKELLDEGQIEEAKITLEDWISTEKKRIAEEMSDYELNDSQRAIIVSVLKDSAPCKQTAQ